MAQKLKKKAQVFFVNLIGDSSNAKCRFMHDNVVYQINIKHTYTEDEANELCINNVLTISFKDR